MLRVHLRVFLAPALVLLLGGADWPQFRGPHGSGATREDGPTSWEHESQLAWKVELPGRGLSGPIIVGSRVLVTACSGVQQDRLHVLCFDADSGEQLWERQFWATGRTMTHNKTCTAAPTPVSDGELVFALFSTNDLFCLDLDGNLIWLRGLGQEYPNANNSLGMASSPVVIDGTLVVKLESDSQSVALGLNGHTGLTRWEVERPKLACWTSPIIVERPDGGYAVGLQSGKGLTAYDPASGKQLWEFPRGCDTIASAIASGRVAYVPSNGLVALRDNGQTGTPEILWEATRLGPSTPSPLLANERVYVINRSILKCADARTGDLLWQLRLDGNFTSSPIAAGDYLYVFNEDGLGQVIRDEGRRGQIVGGGDLGETILCTPAAANGALFVRSDQHLFKLGPEAREKNG